MLSSTRFGNYIDSGGDAVDPVGRIEAQELTTAAVEKASDPPRMLATLSDFGRARRYCHVDERIAVHGEAHVGAGGGFGGHLAPTHRGCEKTRSVNSNRISKLRPRWQSLTFGNMVSNVPLPHNTGISNSLIAIGHAALGRS